MYGHTTGSKRDLLKETQYKQTYAAKETSSIHINCTHKKRGTAPLVRRLKGGTPQTPRTFFGEKKRGTAPLVRQLEGRDTTNTQNFFWGNKNEGPHLLCPFWKGHWLCKGIGNYYLCKKKNDYTHLLCPGLKGRCTHPEQNVVEASCQLSLGTHQQHIAYPLNTVTPRIERSRGVLCQLSLGLVQCFDLVFTLERPSLKGHCIRPEQNKFLLGNSNA